MKRVVVLLLGLALLAPAGRAQTAAGQSPAPQIQNGRVDAHPGTSIDREVTTALSASPGWVAWRVPMVPGDRDLCSWYSDRLGTVRGMWIDEGGSLLESSRPQIAQPTGPKPLEAGTGLVVLLRVVDGGVERIRTAGDDCPMDAGGRTVAWLSNVTPAESLRFLTALANAGADRTLFDLERQMATTAVRAIGLHAGAAADAALESIATKHQDSSVRQQAATSLGAYRGPAGVSALVKLMAAVPAGSPRTSDERRNFAVALGQSRDASAIDALRNLTKDPDARVRSEAWYYSVVRGGATMIPEALKAIGSDVDDSVRRRIVTGISRLPGDVGITTLLQLARAADNPVARKEAFSVLSQSKDPRALALVEEILKRAP